MAGKDMTSYMASSVPIVKCLKHPRPRHTPPHTHTHTLPIQTPRRIRSMGAPVSIHSSYFPLCLADLDFGREKNCCLHTGCATAGRLTLHRESYRNDFSSHATLTVIHAQWGLGWFTIGIEKERTQCLFLPNLNLLSPSLFVFPFSFSSASQPVFSAVFCQSPTSAYPICLTLKAWPPRW